MAGVNVKLTDDISIGTGCGLVLIAGPCVAESKELFLQVAAGALQCCQDLGIKYIFKASFDKANRTSVSSFRGRGIDEGLEILATVKEEFDIPVLTDVHEPWQCEQCKEVVDILQIPAFLSRQTDLLIAAGETGLPVNIKKGQFMAPEDMAQVAKKVLSTGNDKIMLTERGASFGYHNLVVDFRSLVIMRELGYPVIFDATHSVQRPGGNGTSSGGNREYVAPLARAAAAVGIDGLFLETHPHPEKALSDGPNSVPLDELKRLLTSVKEINDALRG
ncbi:MAG: 3-deoxy-8-phosphooctulonate synthase [Victivallales bacterium]|nr:3-deoxy-8-phosphooctulonate synthase [Victivallales bacterium]